MCEKNPHEKSELNFLLNVYNAWDDLHSLSHLIVTVN